MPTVACDLLYALIAHTRRLDSRAIVEEAILLALSAEEYSTAHTFLLALEHLKPWQRWQMAVQLEAPQYMGFSLREATELALQEATRYLGGRSYRRYISVRYRKKLLDYVTTLVGTVPEEQLARTRKTITKLTTGEVYLCERILDRAKKRWKSPETAYQAFDAFLVGITRAHYLAQKKLAPGKAGS
jgi:hypothetical protein